MQIHQLSNHLVQEEEYFLIVKQAAADYYSDPVRNYNNPYSNGYKRDAYERGWFQSFRRDPPKPIVHRKAFRWWDSNL